MIQHVFHSQFRILNACAFATLLVCSGVAQEPGLVTWWSFSSDRQQGASIKAWTGPNITPSGSYRFAEEPPPGRIELSGRDERLLISESVTEVELPKQDVTVEAWVRVDQAQQWGGIFSAIQDNGEFERGLLLGFRDNQFAFAVATEANGRLTYLTASEPFSPGYWYHVAGTYDGVTQRIYVNGQLSGESQAQSGPIQYAPSGPVVVGAYQDSDEFHRMAGALEELRVFDKALTAADVKSRYERRESVFPEPTPEPVRLALPYGPFVDWIDRTTAVVSWESDVEMPSELELFGPSDSTFRYSHDVAKKNHELRLTDLPRDTELKFRIVAPKLDGVEHVTPRYIFDTSFYYQPAAVPTEGENLAARDPQSADLARKLLERSGVRQGWGLVLGALDGKVILELVRQSDLKLVVVESDARIIANVRKLLNAAGVYGVRVSVHNVAEGTLPYGSEMANLVLSESSLSDLAPPKWSFDEVNRVLRPSGGTALFRLSDPASAVVKDAAWNEWLGPANAGYRRRGSLGGQWVQIVKEKLAGGGDWSHQYGSANNTSSSLDEHVRGELEVSWWGDPGPRPMPDRGPRNPAPLSVNGRLYIQGDRILFGLDAYNGSILWTMIAPEVRRANLPRDSSNTAADDTTLYLVHNAYCIEVDGQTGVRRKRHTVPLDDDEKNFDWGYVALVDGHLIGSRVKRESRYKGDSGEWFEDYHPDQVSRVVSDTLFGSNVDGSGEPWQYRRGAILNSTITIGDDMIFFIESRNPEAMNTAGGRVHPDLLTDTHLVALDMRSGTRLWEAKQDFSKLQFMTYLVYSDNKVVATGTDSSKNFHTYAFTAPAPITPTEEVQPLVFGGQPIWSNNHKEDKGHHSGHLQHPVVVDGVFYSDQRAFDLDTGETIRTDLPERRGCGTMSAGRHALFFRHYYHGMWDLETDKRTQFEGIRGGCWLGLIPAGGMLLAPESSAGCSCTHAIQTSVGYAPKTRVNR